LVKGEHMSVDGSFIQANADHHSRVPREQLAEIAKVNYAVREYLAELERENPVGSPVAQQEKVSTTDPDSTYATKGGPARLGYYDNYLVDMTLPPRTTDQVPDTMRNRQPRRRVCLPLNCK
jgi:hypothetical protein